MDKGEEMRILLLLLLTSCISIAKYGSGDCFQNRSGKIYKVIEADSSCYKVSIDKETQIYSITEIDRNSMKIDCKEKK
jgi:hypothetical protein